MLVPDRTLLTLAFAASLIGVPHGVAQGPPPGTDPVTPWPDAAVAESLKVLATLDSVVRRNRNDAAAWHRRGMISWGLMYRARVGPPYSGLDWTRLGRQADTSLRIAARIAPDTPRYGFNLAQYFMASGVSTMRAQAYTMIEDALDAARDRRDPAFLTDALLEYGRMAWLKYDAVWFQIEMVSGPGGCWFPGGAAWRDAREKWSSTDDVFKAHREAYARCAIPLHGRGEEDYDLAERTFREAYAIAHSPRAFRQIAMVIVDQSRWRDLRTLAREHVRRVPTDGWGWMALALAEHRLRGPMAGALFDTAMATLGAHERDRLVTFQRVLRPADTLTFVNATADRRARLERMHWREADPLWSRAGGDVRTEFLARVAYAELRWTVDELGARGADSDRGEIYIRYGPPDAMGMLRGVMATTFWVYDAGPFFMFEGAATYGTARHARSLAQSLGEVTNKTPATWGNAVAGEIYDIAVRTARFRTGSDSIDFYIAALAPAREIRRSSGTTAPIDAGLWIFNDRDNEIADTASQFTNDGTKVWIRRLAPSSYTYRIEATARNAPDAARVIGSVVAQNDTAGFPGRGFGISDLLVVSRAQPRGAPARWSDFDMMPLLSPASTRGELALIWETYELAARDGQASYSVTLTIEPQRGFTGRVLAEVIGALASAVGVNRREDRVTFTWERNAPHNGIMVDNIALSLGETPPGDYRVTLDVTDGATGRKVSRTTLLSIAQ